MSAIDGWLITPVHMEVNGTDNTALRPPQVRL